MSNAKARCQADGGLVGLDRLFEPPQVAQGVAQVGEDIRHLAIDGDGAAVAGGGDLDPSLGPQRDAQIGVGLGIIRVEDEGLGISADGFVEAAVAMMVKGDDEDLRRFLPSATQDPRPVAGRRVRFLRIVRCQPASRSCSTARLACATAHLDPGGSLSETSDQGINPASRRLNTTCRTFPRLGASRPGR